MIDDYAEDQFATFLNTKLAADVPANDAGDRVVVHTLTPATPGAPASGTAEGRENAHLRVRLNGEWYETALDNVKTDENGMATVTASNGGVNVIGCEMVVPYENEGVDQKATRSKVFVSLSFTLYPEEED